MYLCLVLYLLLGAGRAAQRGGHLGDGATAAAVAATPEQVRLAPWLGQCEAAGRAWAAAGCGASGPIVNAVAVKMAERTVDC